MSSFRDEFSTPDDFSTSVFNLIPFILMFIPCSINLDFNHNFVVKLFIGFCGVPFLSDLDNFDYRFDKYIKSTTFLTIEKAIHLQYIKYQVPRKASHLTTSQLVATQVKDLGTQALGKSKVSPFDVCFVSLPKVSKVLWLPKKSTILESFYVVKWTSQNWTTLWVHLQQWRQATDSRGPISNKQLTRIVWIQDVWLLNRALAVAISYCTIPLSMSPTWEQVAYPIRQQAEANGIPGMHLCPGRSTILW